MVHQNGIRARDVEAVFNESRRRQHVVAALGEFQHDFFEFLLAHLPMRHANARRGHQALNERGHAENGFHTVVNKEDLALPVHFLKDR